MKFQAPNFRCRVADCDLPNKKFSRLIFAKDKKEAEEILTKRYYKVYSVQDYDFAKKWQKATDKAKREAQKKRGGKSRKPYNFPALWAPLKEVLLDMFHNKCGYCDAAFPHVEYGDVEHFRPKAEVTEDANHPGYWWLAYETANYLPSCQLCNQGSAKKNHFPVGGKRAYGPGDKLEDEQPDLLNPYQDDFHQHLRFNPSTADEKLAGRIDGLTKRGEVSVEFYRLNRPKLWEFRLKEQKEALQQYRQHYAAWIQHDLNDSLRKFVDSCVSGTRQFAWAAMAEVETFAAQKGIKPPFPRNGKNGG